MQYHHAVWCRALGEAERWGLVPRNVARLVTPARVQRAELEPAALDRLRYRPQFNLRGLVQLLLRNGADG